MNQNKEWRYLRSCMSWKTIVTPLQNERRESLSRLAYAELLCAIRASPYGAYYTAASLQLNPRLLLRHEARGITLDMMRRVPSLIEVTNAHPRKRTRLIESLPTENPRQVLILHNGELSKIGTRYNTISSLDVLCRHIEHSKTHEPEV